jgi:hypothetical protein
MTVAVDLKKNIFGLIDSEALTDRGEKESPLPDAVERIASPIFHEMRESDQSCRALSGEAGLQFCFKQPIEDQLDDHLSIDLCSRYDDFSFLKPNEKIPEDYIPILAEIAAKGYFKPGAILSVGTERIIFLLLLADERVVSSLIGIDLNPRVKAYLDCLICLVHISRNRRDFVSLAIKKNVGEIVQRLKECRMLSEKMKGYYLQYINVFADVYYSVKKDWVSISSFDCVNYWRHSRVFKKLKRYVDARAVISIQGSLTDELPPVPISIIDQSNCLKPKDGSHRDDEIDLDKDSEFEYHPNGAVPLPGAIIRTTLRKEFILPHKMWDYKWRPFCP